MKKLIRLVIPVCIIVAFTAAAARSLPIGFSAFGGIGQGYYKMSDLNTHIGNVGQELGVNIEGISSGINVMLQGRIWFLGRFAVSGGYQHLWSDTSTELTDPTLTYKSPGEMYSIGAVLTVFSFPNLFDIDAGVNYCFASTTFGTNLDSARRLREFKGDDNGFELFAEVMTNFVRPVEVGFQLGYRGVSIANMEDKRGDSPADYYPSLGDQFKIDYSGAFFYLVAGIRL